MKALRSGWYLGDEKFRDQLLSLIKKSPDSKKTNQSGDSVKAYGMAQAEALIIEGLERMGIGKEGGEQDELSMLPKGDARKVALAILIRERTNVSNLWLAERLQMGQSGSVSRLIKTDAATENVKLWKEKLTKM